MRRYRKLFEKPGVFIVPLLLLITALLLLASGDCEKEINNENTSAAPAVILVNQNGRSWKVEVELARTEREKKTGLMYRKNLPPDHGMLFVYDNAKMRTFWMKNTYIPLDIIFIAPDKTIAGIVKNAEPETLDSRGVNRPSKWVLEVNGGQAARHGLQAGDRALFKDIRGH